MAGNRRLVGALGAAVLVVAALIVGVVVIARPTGSNTATAAPTGAHEADAQSTRLREAVSEERLPDLDQETPSELDVRVDGSQGRPTYRLGFRSAVRNVGTGPLTVEGARSDTSVPTMRVDQLIDRGGEPPRVIPDVGRMQYSVSPDHSHWHYLQFERYELQRYELRRAGSSEAIVTDRKTGFCLGDRYRAITQALPAAPPVPVYTGGCGLAEPELLHMREGISVGYGDDYSAFLEGQDLPLDGLADGPYVLVHRVNLDRNLWELSYANNAASVLLDLHWEDGTPTLTVLASCPDTDRCDR